MNCRYEKVLWVHMKQNYVFTLKKIKVLLNECRNTLYYYIPFRYQRIIVDSGNVDAYTRQR